MGSKENRGLTKERAYRRWATIGHFFLIIIYKNSPEQDNSMRWMYYHKDISKQINVTLLVGVIFVVFYTIFDFLGGTAVVLKWISLFCVAYFFVLVLMFSKKWIDKNYR